MKKNHRCPQCHSRDVGYLDEIKDSAVNRLVVGAVDGGLFVRSVGNLEAYVCTTCGFFQTYVKEPQMIPFDKIKGFRWLNDESAKHGPYR